MRSQPEGALDPFVGSIIADRYEVTELLSVGGMARLYRAVQRSLDRTVVIKIIDPALLTGDEGTAEEAVARFMVEAQAASRLNHPNVVNVFDFGRTSPADGGQLFLVMELLGGSDLRDVLESQPLLPILRIANILRQVLAALGEAHYLGMTHRDVKPENVNLEGRRGGIDHVKVIDFGLAKLDPLQSVTQAGRAVGTPHYMSPEQVQGKAFGSGDLYAVGIMLFEMLTGRVPFDGDAPTEIMLKHLRAPRPDPRTVAPERDIPPALANVCMRAIHADPAQRFTDAETLSAAIVRASGLADASSSFDLGPASLHPGFATSPSNAPSPPEPEVAPLTEEDGPLFGRDAELQWFARAVSDASGTVLVGLHGRAGVGKSRLLRDAARAAEAAGTVVVRVRALPAPRSETGYLRLGDVVSRLTSLPAEDPSLASGTAAREPAAAAGLRAVFSRDPNAERARTSNDARRRAAAALSWAARQAVAAARGATVLLAIDDVDRLDGASLLALRDVIAAERIERFVVATTSVGPLEGFPADRMLQRSIGGLQAEHVEQMLQLSPGTVGGVADVEPLLLAVARRWSVDLWSAHPRPSVGALVERRMQGMPMVQRRLLQSVAITGGGTFGELAAVESRRGDLNRALEPLADAGFLEVDADEGVSLCHEAFARAILASIPAGVAGELHARAAEALVSRPDRLELRAYHAVRGQPDFETFMLVEEVASLRAARGDDDGALAILSAGLQAGKLLLMHGELEAGGSACSVFARRLSASLTALGRHDEAAAVLREAAAV